MPKFSAHLTQLFTDVPFRERFARAARAGFAACEFRSPFEYAARDVAGWLAASGLVNVLFNMPAGNWTTGERGIAALPGREAEFRDGVALALDYARALGTPMLHAMAGKEQPGVPREVQHEVLVANLRHAARALAAEGRTLLIEPINTRDVPGYFLTRQADAHAIRCEVGEPNLRVQMDFYHAQMQEGDVERALRAHLAAIGHIQVAGVPGRHEPDGGDIDYPRLFELLDDLGYDGWIGCEYVPRGHTEDGLPWLGRAVARGRPGTTTGVRA